MYECIDFIANFSYLFFFHAEQRWFSSINKPKVLSSRSPIISNRLNSLHERPEKAYLPLEKKMRLPTRCVIFH